MSTEEWLPIPGYEHLGEVSNLGRIRSRNHAIRKTVIGNNGYERVGLKAKGAKNTNYVTVHRLVALAFCPGFSDGLTVNHINGVKTDNRAENLEWCSLKNNVRHAFRIRLRKGCRRKSKIPHDHRDMLREKIASGATYRTLAERYGVNMSSMWVFLNGRKRAAIINDIAV